MSDERLSKRKKQRAALQAESDLLIPHREPPVSSTRAPLHQKKRERSELSLAAQSALHRFHLARRCDSSRLVCARGSELRLRRASMQNRVVRLPRAKSWPCDQPSHDRATILQMKPGGPERAPLALARGCLRPNESDPAREE